VKNPAPSLARVLRRYRLAVVLIVGPGFLELPGSGQTPADQPQSQSRAQRLGSFFRSHSCPQPFHIEDYLHAADLNHIDYRFLPAVSVRESTCGLHSRRNNRWGWGPALTRFENISRGIHYIAFQLAFGRYYRGKSVDQKLLVYNPDPVYVRQVKKLMEEIDGD